MTVRGLTINGFAYGAGIQIDGPQASQDWIYGNRIGTDPTGSTAVPNRYGVMIDGAQDNVIGTRGAGASGVEESNLISGNTAAGVEIGGAAGPSIDGQLQDSAAQDQNLTADGTIDWAVWGYADGGASTSLAPDVQELGGTGISDLTSLSNGNPLRGLGQFGGSGLSFNWSNGTGPATAAGAEGGIQHDGEQSPKANNVGEGFSFTVPASPQARTLRVYVTANFGTAMLTATLSDGTRRPLHAGPQWDK